MHIIKNNVMPEKHFRKKKTTYTLEKPLFKLCDSFNRLKAVESGNVLPKSNYFLGLILSKRKKTFIPAKLALIA